LQTAVSGIYYDSREVQPGGLFCALRGADEDGHRFVQEAVERGAVAILSELPNPAEFTATWLQVSDARAAMARAAANFYGHPSQEIPVVGVTGTNGKTTTTFLIHHLLQSILRRAGLLGTICYS